MTASSDETYRTWTLKLRDGIRFHDGRACNAEDLEFSVIRHLVSPTLTPNRSELAGIEGASEAKLDARLAGLKILDSQTIKIHLTEPDRTFSQAFFDPRLGLVPREHLQSDLFRWKNLPIAAGPLRVEERIEAGFRLRDRVTGRKLELYASTDASRVEASDVLLLCPEANVPVGFDEFVIPQYPACIMGLFFNYDSDRFQPVEARRELRDLVALDDISLTRYQSVNRSLFPLHYAKELGLDFAASRPVKGRRISAQRDPIRILKWRSDWCSEIANNLTRRGIAWEQVDSFDKADIRFIGFVPHAYSKFDVFKYFVPGGTWISRLETPNPDFWKLMAEAYQCQDEERLKELTLRLHREFTDQAWVIPLFEINGVINFKAHRVARTAIANFGFDWNFERLT